MATAKNALIVTAQVVAVLYVLRMLNLRPVNDILDSALRG